MKRHAPIGAIVVGLVGAALSAPTPAAAQVLERQVAKPRPENWQAALGLRSVLVRSAGYDPFSTSDALPQLSLAMQRVLVRSNGFVFAAGGASEFGQSDASARSAASELQAFRFSVITEGRYQPWERGYGFLRFAPGLLAVSTRLTDASTPNGTTLEDSFNLFSADVSAGAAIRIGPPANPVAAWATAEAGYSWAGSHHLLLAPAAAPRDQAKLAPVDLGTIEPRGPFLRIAIAIAY